MSPTQPDVCTCVWSPVTTTTEDPPHIVERDPNCPRHGTEALRAAVERVLQAEEFTPPGSHTARRKRRARRQRDAAWRVLYHRWELWPYHA